MSMNDLKLIKKRTKVDCPLQLTQLNQIGKCSSAERKAKLEVWIQSNQQVEPSEFVNGVYLYLKHHLLQIQEVEESKVEYVMFNVF